MTHDIYDVFYDIYDGFYDIYDVFYDVIYHQKRTARHFSGPTPSHPPRFDPKYYDM